MTPAERRRLVGVLAGLALVRCNGLDRGDAGRFDAASRDTGVTMQPDAALWIQCLPGQQRCYGDVHQSCQANGEFTQVINQDCTANSQVCVDSLWCVTCRPGMVRCNADQSGTETCLADGSAWMPVQTCNADNGEACRDGACVALCQASDILNTNIGCEYYAADLDNAVVPEGNAAAQPYAVVVSNPDPRLTVRVHVEYNTAPVGMPPHAVMVGSAIIAPMDLEVFLLPQREVDCSTVGGANNGTGTCLSSQAYHIVSSIPVVAYQFNPLSNDMVFSNDASLLLPVNSISGDYVTMGWPQTIATTTDPNTNFSLDLRAFLTIIGTHANTHVHIVPAAHVIPGGPIAAPGLMAGQPFDVTLGAFDVMNLETGGFQADLTGSRITSDAPVAVFTGTEASDAPIWNTMMERLCCADHQEEQLAPRQSAAADFVAVRTASRSQAVNNAGGTVAVVSEPQFFRILAVGDTLTHVDTTLRQDQSDPTSSFVSFDLMPGQQQTLRAYGDFTVHGDSALFMQLTTGGQQTTGIPSTLPGGDPSMITIPPVRQWRQNYVFLTPDKYAFDFVTVVARPTTNVQLDGTPLPFSDCPMARADSCVDRPGQPACPAPAYVVYRCQLSFPIIDSTHLPPLNVLPGRQQDGVHTITSDDAAEGVMVIVNGFDNYVGYGYPGGLRTVPIN